MDGQLTAGDAMTDLLAVYLNDHLAASAGGVGLARRARDAHRDDDHDRATFALLADVTSEIEADKEQLERIIGMVGARRDHIKQLMAVGAERVARLKANGRLARRSPLSSLIELEGLAIAVQGKRCGWRALQQLEDPRLSGIDLGWLVARAEEQYQRLEERRLAVAAQVLSPDGRPG